MDADQLKFGRRWFLLKASAATAAGIAAAEQLNKPLRANAQSSPQPTAGVQTFTTAQLHDDVAALQSAPGNNKLVNLPTFSVALMVETNKAAKEFEWHESRDHIFQILEGSTLFELGGTPVNAHSSKAGEWNSPESQDAVKLTLSKGDMLIVPRGVPHRRTTKDSVTLMLISPQGTA
ncbi:MAG TPA: hypothetical protein VL986_05210 [Terracidiphilus sp.]|nr:hypothetical protein [Terracidiphilus sp.]